MWSRTPPSVSPSATKVPKAGPATTTLVHNRDLFLCSTGIHPILGYLVQVTKAGMYIELADLLPEVLSEVQFDLAKYTLKARDLQVHHNPGLECSLCHLHGHCCSFTAAVGLQPCNLHVHCDWISPVCKRACLALPWPSLLPGHSHNTHAGLA